MATLRGQSNSSTQWLQNVCEVHAGQLSIIDRVHSRGVSVDKDKTRVKFDKCNFFFFLLILDASIFIK